jgi:hypothetical protein
VFERLKALYLDGRLSDAGLSNAVTKGWITEEQATEIRDAKVSGADS